jgi:hypothetical protein
MSIVKRGVFRWFSPSSVFRAAGGSTSSHGAATSGPDFGRFEIDGFVSRQLTIRSVKRSSIFSCLGLWAFPVSAQAATSDRA